MARHPDTHLLGMPLARHRLEGRLCFLQAYCSKLLRLQSRVDATLEQARRILPRLPGSAEVHVGITAQHQAFFLAGKTIFPAPGRSEEHTSELQSLMRISYAVFCLKK